LIRLLCLALLLSVQPAAAGPRIVSINPCVDAVLLQVADPAQIAGISHYSQDPRATSIPLKKAERFTATSGTAEEILALAPDLVIAGAHVSPSTVAALKRLKIDVLLVGVPDSIAASKAQIHQIAAAAGHADRGVMLNQRIDAAVFAARPAGTPVSALIWQSGGLVPGRDTLADELLTVTGFRNMSTDYGLKSWDVLPLEHLIARPPRLLLSVGGAPGEDRMLGHPVLRPLADQIAIRPFSERLLHCGGPTIIDAVNHLASVRRAL